MKGPWILRFHPSTADRAIWPLSDMIGCWATIEGGGMIAGVAPGLCRLDFGLPAPEPLRTFVYGPENIASLGILGDGKAHTDDNFCAG